MFNISAYTPLESLLLFQSLLSHGINASAFSRISSLLKDNAYIKKDTRYDAARLSPEPLQELFLHLLRDELKLEIENSAKSDGSQSPNKRRKLQTPPLHNLQEALAHLQKFPKLLNRLYVQYKEHQIRQIRDDEDQIRRLQREIDALEIKGEFAGGPVEQTAQHAVGKDVGVRVSPEERRDDAKLPNGTSSGPVPGLVRGSVREPGPALPAIQPAAAAATANAASPATGASVEAGTRASTGTATPASTPTLSPPQGPDSRVPSAPQRQPSPAAGLKPAPMPVPPPRPSPTGANLMAPDRRPSPASPQPSPRLHRPPAPPRAPSPAAAGVQSLLPNTKLSPAGASLTAQTPHTQTPQLAAAPSPTPQVAPPPTRPPNGAAAPPVLQPPQAVSAPGPALSPRPAPSPQLPHAQPKRVLQRPEPLGTKSTPQTAQSSVPPPPPSGGPATPLLKWEPPYQPQQHVGQLQKPLAAPVNAAQFPTQPRRLSPAIPAQPAIPTPPHPPQLSSVASSAPPAAPSLARAGVSQSNQLSSPVPEPRTGEPRLVPQPHAPQPPWNSQPPTQVPGQTSAHLQYPGAQPANPRPIRPQPGPRASPQPGVPLQPSGLVAPQQASHGQLQAPSLQAPPLRAPGHDSGLAQQPFGSPLAPGAPLLPGSSPGQSQVSQPHPPNHPQLSHSRPQPVGIAPAPPVPPRKISPQQAHHTPTFPPHPQPQPQPQSQPQPPQGQAKSSQSPRPEQKSPGAQPTPSPHPQNIPLQPQSLQQTPVLQSQLHTSARLAGPGPASHSPSPVASPAPLPLGDTAGHGGLPVATLPQHLIPGHLSTPKPGPRSDFRLSQLPLAPRTPINTAGLGSAGGNGSATRWKTGDPTPSTPRAKDSFEVTRPRVEPLSPVLAPATLPKSQSKGKGKAPAKAKHAPTNDDSVDQLAEEPSDALDASASTPQSGFSKAQMKRQQVQKIDTSATPKGRGRPRGSRAADTQQQSPPTARRPRRRSSPDELQADSEPDSARVKNEEETPRPLEETGDTTADESVPSRRRRVASNGVASRRGKRKRADSVAEEPAESLADTPSAAPASTRAAAAAAAIPSFSAATAVAPAPALAAASLSRGPPPGPPTHVLWTRGFNKISAPPLDQISSHRHANMFAHQIRDRDAPGYKNIVLGPMDLKSIRAAIIHGNKSAMQATALLPDDDKSASAVWLPISEDLVPPKAIINSAQLDRELVHMFANAIMYNADPHRGPGPAFIRREDHEEDAGGIGGAGGGPDDPSALGYYKVDENSVVNDTRSMFVEVEKLLSNIREAENDRGVPPPPPGSSAVPGSAAAAVDSKTAVDRATTAEDDGEDAAEAEPPAAAASSASGTGTVKRRRITRG